MFPNHGYISQKEWFKPDVKHMDFLRIPPTPFFLQAKQLCKKKGILCIFYYKYCKESSISWIVEPNNLFDLSKYTNRKAEKIILIRSERRWEGNKQLNSLCNYALI